MTFEEFKTRTRINAHELMMANDLEFYNLAMLNTAAKNAKFDILERIKNKIMTIKQEEIREDFRRFIRHEAMRANCTQKDILSIILGELGTLRTFRELEKDQNQNL